MKCRVLAVLLAVFVCPLAAVGQTAPAPAASGDISSLAPPAHPASEAQIREYLALTHTIETAHQLIKDELHTSRTTSAAYLTPGFWDDMEAALMRIDLAQYFIPAFQKYFSEEDMAATIAFYKITHRPTPSECAAFHRLGREGVADCGWPAGRYGSGQEARREDRKPDEAVAAKGACDPGAESVEVERNVELGRTLVASPFVSSTRLSAGRYTAVP